VKWIFSTDFPKKKGSQYQISWKSVQWESNCSMLKDGQTDRHDAVTVVCRTRLKYTAFLCSSSQAGMLCICLVARTVGRDRAVNRVKRPSIALTRRGNLNTLKKVLHCRSATGCTANSTQSITGSSPVHQGEELTLSYVTHDHTEHVWMFVKRMLLGIKLCSLKDGRDGVVRV